MTVRVIPVRGAKLPTRGLLSYGYQRSATHVHNGVDLAAPEGTPVLAAEGGVVAWALHAWRQGFTGYGRAIVVEHPSGVWTLYAHCSRVDVVRGQRVAAGDIIGAVGRTQYEAPEHTSLLGLRRSHLHFEVSPRSYPQASSAKRLDPVAWLRAGTPNGTPPASGPLPVADASGPGGGDGGAVAIAIATAAAIALG